MFCNKGLRVKLFQPHTLILFIASRIHHNIEQDWYRWAGFWGERQCRVSSRRQGHIWWDEWGRCQWWRGSFLKNSSPKMAQVSDGSKYLIDLNGKAVAANVFKMIPESQSLLWRQFWAINAVVTMKHHDFSWVLFRLCLSQHDAFGKDAMDRDYILFGQVGWHLFIEIKSSISVTPPRHTVSKYVYVTG